MRKLLVLFGLINTLMFLPGLAKAQSIMDPGDFPARKASDETVSIDVTRLPGHVLSVLNGATPKPASLQADTEPLTLTVILKRTDQDSFDRYLHDLYDPNSPVFHHFLNQTEMADRFGPTREEYEAVWHYLKSQGFKLVDGSANRLTLTVRGTRSQAESAFALHLGDYQLGKWKFYANDRDPALPTRIASSVQAVAGLSDLARPHAVKDELHNLGVAICKWFWSGLSTTAPVPSFAACGSYIPNKFFYNLRPDPPGWDQSDGNGQTIGLIEFDTFLLSDVADFLGLIGAPATLINNVSEVQVNGGAAPGPDQDEVLLDIDTVLSIAPGAKIVVYDGPFTGPGTSFQSLFNAAINGGSTIISNSWAYCEDQTTAADVQSIDSLLQAAAAAGITVFNGAGDSGGTCLDGSPNTVAVPAGSPSATAVGGSSISGGHGYMYGPEKWWDGTSSMPPTGQGGFGVSRFFTKPDYQTGITASAMRSVPDVVANADPASGTILCQASTGGCPNGLLYGGTSIAAPAWAAFAAVLNQALGHNIGAFNQAIYPLANTSAFHNAASLNSDFAHVGLGSPNLNQLYLKLSGTTVGIPDVAHSGLFPYMEAPLSSLSIGVVPADGQSPGFVNVVLVDGNGNPVPGKTVTLSANPGSHAQISPASSVTTLDNGTASFTLTDLTTENVTITATDMTDGLVLPNTITVPFVVPPAASAGINAFPTPIAADGMTATTITLTLQDGLGRPTPGKLVTLAQGTGHSVIQGPTPSLTDNNGQIQFTAVNQVAETVTYTATDVTDGNLPFPASGTVTFTGGLANGCGNGNPVAAPGFLITPYATGFVAQNFSYGNINNTGCPGAFGIAFDGSGNLYVADAPIGNIYKFPPGGGVANSGTLLTPTPIGPSLGHLAFANGNLFAGRNATTGNFTTGAVLKIDPGNGTVSTVASPLTCPSEIAIDPLSGDLFTDDSCGGGGSDNPSLWRISNPAGATPTPSVYTTFPGTPNATLAFAPSGTLYAWAVTASGAQIAKVSGTNGPATPTVSILPNLLVGYLGLLAGGMQSNGDAAFLVLNYAPSGNVPGGIGIADLTTNPPSISSILVMEGVVNNNNFALGPDGCVYVALGDAVFRITDTGGVCNYTAAQPAPTIALTPTVISPNPAQGSSQSFTATLHYVNAPAGTPVSFQVTGANPQVKMVQAGANGQASFNYVAVSAGADTVLASATINTSSVLSNPVQFTWTAGPHTTFLTLNPSRTGGHAGSPVTVTASLTDISTQPATPLSGQLISFALDGSNCTAFTDVNGIASCAVTPGPIGMGTLTASIDGTSQFLPASTFKGFRISASGFHYYLPLVIRQ